MGGNINEWGEEGVIARIVAAFAGDDGIGVQGIGDDCSVLPLGDGCGLLTTSDLLVEGIHFTRDDINPKDLGFKSLQVNLSDVAAMGGVPNYFWLNLALPQSLESEWVDQFIVGLQEAANAHDVRLLGGDTTGATEAIVISITLQGKGKLQHIKYRHGAKVGDKIAVTGFLGDAAAGLQCLQQGLMDYSALISAQQRPQAQVKLGQWLAQQAGVTAMMDLSDGLYLDLQRLCQRSGCGAQVDLAALPVSSSLQAYCQQQQQSLYDLAALGGEDYGLLVAIAPDALAVIAQNYPFSTPLTVIGEIIQQQKIEYYLDDHSYQFQQRKPFEHF